MPIYFAHQRRAFSKHTPFVLMIFLLSPVKRLHMQEASDSDELSENLAAFLIVLIIY